MYFSPCRCLRVPISRANYSPSLSLPGTKSRLLVPSPWLGIGVPIHRLGEFRQFHASAPNLQARSPDPFFPKPMLPTLMDFPMLQWPSFINTIRNWVFVYLVIRPHMDPDFSIKDFMVGAKEAVAVVSQKLASGDWDDLEGLVEPSTLSTLKTRLSTFSLFQRELIAMSSEDVFFAYPHQVGIIIPEPDSGSTTPPPFEWTEGRGADSPETQDQARRPPQKRFIEITVVLHVLKGFAKMQASGEMVSLRDFLKDDAMKHNVMICNYRFFRDFTKGVQKPEWIINMLNHFLPADHMDLKKK